MTATPAVGGVTGINLDCAEPLSLGRFWSALLGLRVVAQDADRFVDLEPIVPGGPTLSLVAVPEPKTVKNRLHLDVQVEDLGAATERVTALGGQPASRVRGAKDAPWGVFRDPEGNEFCLVTG